MIERDYKIKKEKIKKGGTFNDSPLKVTLGEMRRLYEENPQLAIRGRHFVKELDKYCAEELRKRLGIPVKDKDEYIKFDYSLYGAYKPKTVDVALVSPEAGILALISSKAPVRSINANLDTLCEGLIGDATNIHDKFPTLVFGFLCLLPKEEFSDNPERINFQKMINVLRQITGRKDPKEMSGKYERAALIVVDFKKNPPQISEEIPNKNEES